MKFLVITTDYPAFLTWLYAQYPGLSKQPYEEQIQNRIASFFSSADFYSSNLIKLGHEARDISFSNVFMQRKWANEHGLILGPEREWQFVLRRGFVPWFRRIRNISWFHAILEAQIKFFKPDVVFNLAMDGLSPAFLKTMKPYFSLLIGNGEPPVLFEHQDWSVYDLILAPSEPMVNHFKSLGIKAELLRFGFEPRTVQALTQSLPEKIPISFVGSLGRYHTRRHELLEYLCFIFGENISIWTPSLADISKNSPIRDCYQGPAWGHLLYQILFNSKISINCHINVAGNFADNMRLFEATGMGTLLITDWKENLDRIFDLDKEVVTYKNQEECADKIKYYLDHEMERAEIAKNGKERTLKQHTYFQRMEEFIHIVKKHLP